MNFSEVILTRVEVRGYRSLEHVAVDLEPVTVLAGPNGSGKSAFVDALAFLQEAVSDSPEAALKSRGGLEQLLTQTGQRPRSLSIEVQIRSRAPELFEGSYLVELGQVAQRLSVNHEACEMAVGPDKDIQRFEVVRGQWRASTAGVRPDLAEGRLALPLMSGLEHFAPLYRALDSIYLYAIPTSTLRARQAQGPAEHLSPDGSNATSVLRALRDKDEDVYQRILQTISLIVPSVRSITTRREGRTLKLVFNESFVGHKALSFDAADMSEGTLHVLGILLAVYQAQPPTLVCLEEPEAAVHPGAAAVLAESLLEAGLRTQVLITTHSPDLITRFEVDALRAVERTETGVSRIAPILESQRAAVRERLFTAGELHRIEGLQPAP